MGRRVRSASLVTHRVTRIHTICRLVILEISTLTRLQMRLKLQTKPPLPEIKAWFAPHSDNVPATIGELKYLISCQIPSLQISGKDVLLLLDDFELLDDSPLDVVRDGDLILVKALSQGVDSVGSKSRMLTSSACINNSQLHRVARKEKEPYLF